MNSGKINFFTTIFFLKITLNIFKSYLTLNIEN